MPRVSIVLATRDRAQILPRAIESVRAQTFKDWELIVIDDGSTDSTAQLLKNFRLLDPRIRIESQKQRGNLPRARALGVSAAKGEYIALLDDDDTFLPEKLEKQIAFLDENPEITLVYSHVRVLGENHDFPELWPRQPVEDFQTLLKQNVIQPNAVLIRRGFFEKHGNFRTDLLSCDDYELFLRAALHEKITFLPAVVGEYWWHETNMSRQEKRRFKSETKIFRSFLKSEISPEIKTVVRREVGLRHYIKASDAWDRADYRKAAKFYYYALSFNPGIGREISWNKSAGNFYRLMRPYLGLFASSFNYLTKKRKEHA